MLQLRVSHETAIKVLARAAVIPRVDWSRKSLFTNSPTAAVSWRPQVLARWSPVQAIREGKE